MNGQIRRRIDGLVNVRHEVDLSTLATRIMIDLEIEGIDSQDAAEWLKLKIGEIRKDYKDLEKDLEKE